MSRLRKTVIPFRWGTIFISFTQGTAGSVGLSSFITNNQNYPLTYAVRSGALPNGITLSSAGLLSYDGLGVASTAQVAFSATSGALVADSSIVSAVINSSGQVNTAPVWLTAESLGGLEAGQSFSFILTASDAESDVINFAYDPPPFGTVSVQPQVGGTAALVWSGTAPTTPGSFTFTVDASDTIPLGRVSNVTAAATGSTAIGVSWSAVSNATSYTVERSLTGAGAWNLVGITAGVSITATGLAPSTLYYFRVKATNATQEGAYSTNASATTSASVVSGDWAARSTAPGVVWAHRFENQAELTNHLNPADNADLGGDVAVNVTPNAVTPHILTEAQESDGVRCLEITQLGAELASVLDTAPVTIYDWPTASITPIDSSTGLPVGSGTLATLTLPSEALSLGINGPLDTFKIVNGLNAGIFLSSEIPASNEDSLTTFNVLASNRTPVVAQTGLQIQHVKVQSLDNPYQEVVINEHADEVGEETWPSPTGWSAANPTVVPSDAYTVVLHYDTTIGTRSATYKDKVTVVKKQSNTPSAGLSTLTVRRASMGMGDAGRIEAQIINRFFPCEFPVGTLIGRDVTGGWARPLAALPAGANGKSTPDPAVNGTIPVRQWYSGTAPSTWNFRTGYYGHEDYHDEYTPSNPFTPNTYPENGEYPFNGNEFWLTWKMKLSPMFNLRENSSKLMFLDQHQTPDMSQIVMNAPKRDLNGNLLGNLLWFHNYGSQSNSDLPDIESVWSPSLGQWFDLMIHIRTGHDNRMEYNSGYTISEVVSKVDNDPNYGGLPTITVKTGLISLAPGLVLKSGPNTGRYPGSNENPQALDPQRSGYFDNWRFEFKGDSINGTYRSRDFKILSHTVSGGATTFVITKLRDLDAWPTVSPAVGSTVKFSWIDLDTSARYKDTLVELYKKESSDTDWVQVRSFYWPITYNGGSDDSSAGNPKGFNNFQPTGYANIDDNNPPGSRTIYTRYADIILSQSQIGVP